MINRRAVGTSLLLVGSSAALIGSFLPWGTCRETPCGGPFQAFSFLSGIDVGVGVLTALLAFGLAIAGARISTLPSDEHARLSRPIVVAALGVVATAFFFGLAPNAIHPRMSGPDLGAVVVAAGGMVSGLGGLLIGAGSAATALSSEPIREQ